MILTLEMRKIVQHWQKQKKPKVGMCVRNGGWRVILWQMYGKTNPYALLNLYSFQKINMSKQPY